MAHKNKTHTTFVMVMLAISQNTYATNIQNIQDDTQAPTAHIQSSTLINAKNNEDANTLKAQAKNPQSPVMDLEIKTSPICSPDALLVGIEHFAYDEVFAEDLVWSGYGDKSHENKLIHKDVKKPLQDLVKAAAKDKVALYPSSIFRSVRAQDAIIKRKIRQKQPPSSIYFTSSPAGFSEHHTGYAVDFAPIDTKFAKTKGHQWLMQNAQKYGWQKTFTPEFSAKTGVSEESWHWRYVGDERGQSLFAPRTCQPLNTDDGTDKKMNNKTRYQAIGLSYT
ncbi:M15 family metallopeptidase [Moraxella sp. Pampa]|uniref:M15 family metallopeptidase n=1 Tax=Moraxella sp. Pampa TaxID=3111978 RepID=UPI002B407BC3|nr:M15 family metallopeptidase [Moraxella sp. Pampa]